MTIAFLCSIVIPFLTMIGGIIGIVAESKEKETPESDRKVLTNPGKLAILVVIITAIFSVIAAYSNNKGKLSEIQKLTSTIEKLEASNQNLLAGQYQKAVQDYIREPLTKLIFISEVDSKAIDNEYDLIIEIVDKNNEAYQVPKKINMTQGNIYFEIKFDKISSINTLAA